jgi:hypothetical protein
MMRERGEMHAMAPAERRKSRRERDVFGMVLLLRRLPLGVHENYIECLWMGLSNLSKAGSELKIAVKV